MKMYVTKEPHEMRSGFMTVKWRWWFKNEETVSEKQTVIQNSDQVNKARRDFLTNNPEGKVLFKDLTK